MNRFRRIDPGVAAEDSRSRSFRLMSEVISAGRFRVSGEVSDPLTSRQADLQRSCNFAVRIDPTKAIPL